VLTSCKFHSGRSSNLKFFQAVWNAAKRCRGVVSLRRHTPTVDVVAEGGLKWIKVSTINEKRLLFEMAKLGWEWSGDSDSDDDDDDDDEARAGGDDQPDISILKMAEKLARLARETRVKYRHPQVHLELLRLEAGKYREIDALLERIRAMGVTVHCSNDLPPPPPLHAVLHDMFFDEFSGFSQVLNLDCTVLLALVSDISNAAVSEEPWFSKYIRRQLELETKTALFPCVLWPAMANRDLVCTHEAAARMQEIVDTIGTPTEKLRTPLLFTATGTAAGDPTPSDLRAQFQSLSHHTVPTSWRLPIQIVRAVPVTDTRLPAAARAAAARLSDINRSVFLYGWATGRTTLTSNRMAATQLQAAVERERRSDDEVGPDLCVLRTSRSLIAKEKGRQE
jgi:hypothetical protein